MEDGRVAPAVARFLRAGGAAVGGGVLLDGGRVLTCAHVVNSALGRRADAPERPAEPLTLDFPLLGTDPLRAHVVEWSPLVALGSGDVALVELDAIPDGLAPADPTARAVAADEELALFGFPLGRPAGVWKVGLQRAGPLVGEWQQLLGRGARDYKLQPGFSGCPVLDEERRVVGIFAQAEEAGDVDAGAEIPVEVATREVGLALPAPPAPAPTTAARAWNVPPLRNRNFTGRDDVLRALDNLCASLDVVALTGLGGVGKSQIAVQYAYGAAPRLDVVWWVSAEQPNGLVAGLAALAVALELPEAEAAEPPAAAEAARRWLEQNDRWLVVYDNAQDLQAVREWLPQAGRGCALVTSRHSAWGAVARVVRVDPLKEDEAAALLTGRTGQDDDAAARTLTEKLGGLPLALEQAGAYIEATGVTMREYVELFDARHEALLAYSGPVETRTVATTWDLGFDQINTGSPGAAALLRTIAFLAPDDIPRGLFVGNDKLPEPLATVADPILFGDAVAALTSYSLMSVLGDAIAVHRLVQTVTRDRLGDDEQRASVEHALRTLAARFSFDENDPQTWAAAGRLVPHALQACGHASARGIVAGEAALLLNGSGMYLRTHAQLAGAEAAQRGALELARQLYGEEDHRIAALLINLGIVRLERGDYAGALSAYEAALRIDEALYGPDHHEVAIDVSNLGNVQMELGDYGAARKSFERALAIDEAALGPDDPTLAIRLNNLGNALSNQGEFAAGENALARALAIDRAAYGSRHPQVAADLNNIGTLRYRRGDLGGAAAALEEALSIDEEVFGPNHPNVARRMGNIGHVLTAQGDSAGARRAFERALAIDVQVFGPDHPRIADHLSSLGAMLYKEGALAPARDVFERVVAIREQAFGEDSPFTIESVENLEIVRTALGEATGESDGGDPPP